MCDVLTLCAAKRFQDGAGQSRIVSATLKVCDTHLLIENMLRTARNVRLGFRQMLKLLMEIHARSHPGAGGSAIGLSATEA
jgi:hypothetical protein